MKIGVIGNRDIVDEGSVKSEVEEILKKLTEDDNDDFVILTGGAKGPSSFIRDWAEKYGYDTILFKPWHMIDNAVPFSVRLFSNRNRQIIQNSDHVIFFISDEAEGETSSALSYAMHIKKAHTVIKM